ncbi:MAG: hypothetical protein Q8853_02885, partial [Candidatus Phytoplasma australasiaticum]|nr:hypothetical protein [Candidatus Phytoplasma australasiaticum]
MVESFTHKGCEKRGKLDPRFIGPFKILRKGGDVAYELALLSSLSSMYPIFHVFMLRQYFPTEYHMISYDSVELGSDLSYIEEPIAILDKQGHL